MVNSDCTILTCRQVMYALSAEEYHKNVNPELFLSFFVCYCIHTLKL